MLLRDLFPGHQILMPIQSISIWLPGYETQQSTTSQYAPFKGERFAEVGWLLSHSGLKVNSIAHGDTFMTWLTLCCSLCCRVIEVTPVPLVLLVLQALPALPALSVPPGNRETEESLWVATPTQVKQHCCLFLTQHVCWGEDGVSLINKKAGVTYDNFLLWKNPPFCNDMVWKHTSTGEDVSSVLPLIKWAVVGVENCPSVGSVSHLQDIYSAWEQRFSTVLTFLGA